MLWNISGYGRRGSVAGIPVFTIGKDVSAIDILSIQRQNYVNRFTRKSLSARYSQSLQMGRLFIYAFSPCHSFICPAIHINISYFSQHFLPTAPIFIYWLLCVYVSRHLTMVMSKILRNFASRNSNANLEYPYVSGLCLT